MSHCYGTQRMSDEPNTERLSNRLADLKSLGDRQRASHPVTVLRQQLSDVPPPAAEQELHSAPGPTPPQSADVPKLDERARALARRVFSALLSQAEQQAHRIVHERRSSVKDLRRRRDAARRAASQAPNPSNDKLGLDSDGL